MRIRTAQGVGFGNAEACRNIEEDIVSGRLVGDHIGDDAAEGVSRPYIDMTLAVMASFGVAAQNEDYRRFVESA